MNPVEAKLIADFLLAEMALEAPTTTRVFGAVPAGRLDYKPDPASKTALGLLRHITLEDEWLLTAVANGQFVPPPDDSDACGIMTPEDAIARYNKRIPPAMERVRALSGDELVRQIDMFGVMQLPAVNFLSLTVKYSVHHRAQLSTYLRAMGGKVPGIYGPSADTTRKQSTRLSLCQGNPADGRTRRGALSPRSANGSCRFSRITRHSSLPFRSTGSLCAKLSRSRPQAT